MDKKQLINSGKIINQLDRKIKLLEKENRGLKEKLELEGINDLEDVIKYYKDFVKDLQALISRYF